MNDINLKTADVRARIEPDLKEGASQILADCGLTISDAFRLFLRQVVAYRGLPFAVLSPSAETSAAMKQGRKKRRARFASAQELFDGLEKTRPRKSRKSASKE